MYINELTTENGHAACSTAPCSLVQAGCPGLYGAPVEHSGSAIEVTREKTKEVRAALLFPAGQRRHRSRPSGQPSDSNAGGPSPEDEPGRVDAEGGQEDGAAHEQDDGRRIHERRATSRKNRDFCTQRCMEKTPLLENCQRSITSFSRWRMQLIAPVEVSSSDLIGTSSLLSRDQTPRPSWPGVKSCPGSSVRRDGPAGTRRRRPNPILPDS